MKSKCSKDESKPLSPPRNREIKFVFLMTIKVIVMKGLPSAMFWLNSSVTLATLHTLQVLWLLIPQACNSNSFVHSLYIGIFTTLLVDRFYRHSVLSGVFFAFSCYFSYRVNSPLFYHSQRLFFKRLKYQFAPWLPIPLKNTHLGLNWEFDSYVLNAKNNWWFKNNANLIVFILLFFSLIYCFLISTLPCSSFNRFVSYGTSDKYRLEP